VGSLGFGNTRCTRAETDRGACVLPHAPKYSRIWVDSNVSYQPILGFGGAFTESAAHNFYKLSTAAQNKFIALYFGENGIGLTLGRIHINSCDFSLESYCFDNVDGDVDLAFFDHEVTHDQAEV
jgi:glucosylceramidase